MNWLMILKAFIVGGLICLIGQILIDKTKLTSSKILVTYVTLGVILGGLNIYPKLIDFAGCRSYRSSYRFWKSTCPSV